MSKFNVPTPLPSPDARTHEYGEGFIRSPKDELFLLGASNFTGIDTFYEKGEDRDARFESLVTQLTQSDPEWTAAFIRWLRNDGNMRSASLVAAATYVAAGGPSGRQVVSSVLQRPDEPAEMVAYWYAKSRKLPAAVKRGVADAVTRMYSERNVLKYDGKAKPWRFADVIEVTHPKPQSPIQADLFKHLLDVRHSDVEEVPEALGVLGMDRNLQHLPENQRRDHLNIAIECGWSWERLAGWLPGGMNAAAWEAVMPNMGLMALTRNLRNFDEAGISQEAYLKTFARFFDADEVKRSKQFPLRYLSAWKNVMSTRWGPALESAVDLSTSLIPELPGRTLILLDVSASMNDLNGNRHQGQRGESPTRWEAGAVFAYTLARRSPGAHVVLFGAAPKADVQVGSGESILRLTAETTKFVGGGTATLASMQQAYNNEDRVILITDEQSHHSGWSYNGSGVWDSVKHIKVPVYTWNLAGYAVGHAPQAKNWMTMGGLTDSAFGLLDFFEGSRKRQWPWEINATAS